MTDGQADVLVVGGELTELARVREWARSLLPDLDEDLLVDALSVVDELTSNALRHASAPYRVGLRRSNGRLRIEVADGSTAPATPHTPDHVGGRGLMLVEAFSLAWNQELHPDGKIVWAELELFAASPAPEREPAGAPAFG